MKYFSLASIPSFFSLLLVGIIMIAALPLINWMIAINEHLSLPDFMSSIEQWMKESEGAATDIIEAFLKTEGVTAFLYNFFIIAIIPAIGEELLFRGILQPLLIKWTKNVHKGIWITGILFSAFHLQFFGFVPRMLLGVLFGYLLLWSRSLWLPVFAHFINNGMAVIVSYLIQRNAVSKDIETIGSGESETMLIFCSAFLVIAFLFMIYRNKLRKYLITQ